MAIILSQASVDGTSIVFPCGPCMAAASCCFYPFRGSDLLFGTYGDAPNTVLLCGAPPVTMIKYVGFDYVNYTPSGSDLPVGQTQLYCDIIMGIPEDNWLCQSELPYLQGNSDCLFDVPYGISDPSIAVPSFVDDFSTTYTLDGTTTLTRTVATDATAFIQGSCVWSGDGYRLDYGITTQYKYTLTDPPGNQYILTGYQNAPNGSGTGIYGPHSLT